MGTAATPLPPSLAATPNIALRDQTPAQLLAERGYWQARVEAAAGPASASAAAEFGRACDMEIMRRRNVDADAVPTGWVPERFWRESTPPHRSIPTDWIAGPSAWSDAVILAGEMEEIGEADQTRSVVKMGEIVNFIPYTDLGSAEITVHADGTWRSVDRVSRFANCFRDVDGDYFDDTIDKLARQMLEDEPTAFISTKVYVFRWGKPVSFVLASTPEGGFAFQRASTETPS